MRLTKPTIIFLVLFYTGLDLMAQSNTQTITFNLTKTFTSNRDQLESVGGDLVIFDPLDILQCKNASNSQQTLFSATTAPQTLFVNVVNATGNGCVGLKVYTSSGVQSLSIPANSQSGVLKFSKVKKAELIMDRKLSSTVPETVSSSGTATIWF